MTIRISLAEKPSRLTEPAFVLMGAVAVASFVLAPKAGLLALAGCAALWFLALVCEVLGGSIDRLLLFWAALFPLESLVMFPRDHPIVTLDRLVILLAIIGLFLAKPSTLAAIPRALHRAGLACLAFAVVAGVTLVKSADVLGPARVLFDSFVAPILFGWFVLAWFDVRRRLPAIHTAVCICSIICATIAAAEMVTGEDLLPVGNSVMFFAGGIARANGPFASNDELAVSGGLSLFFLLFLRVALGPNVSAARRMLHASGLAAAVGMAVMPMFRSVMLTLLVALVIDTFWEQETSRRAWRGLIILVFGGLISAGSAFAPDIFEDRRSADNAYGRVAQYQQSLRLFTDHPVLGVGFSNFNSFVTGEPQYRASYQGVSSLDWPHNNLASALTETGILGFLPYVLAHVLLLRAMWQIRRLSRSGHMVWKYLLYMFLTYWITGLTESSGFSPFVNLWYVFLITICYKYALTAPYAILPAEARVPDRALSVPAQIL